MLAELHPLLSAAENRSSFFQRVAAFFPKSDPRYKDIARAYDAAKDAFRGKTREGGERYFEHLRAVALILMAHLRIRDPRLIIAALLHDIVEDSPHWTVERVRAEFGDGVALLVDWLTKPPKDTSRSLEERDADYHRRFSGAPREFFIIKLADRLHNVLTLSACPPEKQRRKIEETKRYYLPHAEQELILLHELETAICRIERGWKKKK